MLLHAQSSPFTCPKQPFYMPKAMLLHAKRAAKRAKNIHNEAKINKKRQAKNYKTLTINRL